MTLEKKISTWLKDYLLKHKLESFIIGVSGGIDSAVTSTLCAMTGCKTIVVTMPIYQNLNETDRGMEHCSWLSENYKFIEVLNIDLTEVYEKFKDTIPEKFNNPQALANTRARIRMSTLYLIAGSSKGIVVGTGNKIEDFGVGFFTKYGDGGVDISPIADLMKSEVYDLGKKMKIIDSILNAKPTDGLWDDGRSDEDQLGISYDKLEWAMNYNSEEINKYQQEILDIYNLHRNTNLHKMKAIPVFKKK